MAGIEDFVVEQIVNDFQSQLQSQQPAPTPSASAGAPSIRMFGTDFTPQAFDRYLESPAPGQLGVPLNRRVTQGQAAGPQFQRERAAEVLALEKRDATRKAVMEGLRGLDPQIQATVLKRLGIDPGAVKSTLQQQMELAKYKQQLEQPQQETANALKMLALSQGGQQNAAELALKQQQLAATDERRGEARNIQLMRVLATLMQSDPTGRLGQTIGPILMQLLQSAGINVGSNAPQAPTENTGRSGVKITRVG